MTSIASSSIHQGSLLLDQESVRESSPWKSSNASLGLLESKELGG